MILLGILIVVYVAIMFTIAELDGRYCFPIEKEKKEKK